MLCWIGHAQNLPMRGLLILVVGSDGGLFQLASASETPGSFSAGSHARNRVRLGAGPTRSLLILCILRGT